MPGLVGAMLPHRHHLPPRRAPRPPPVADRLPPVQPVVETVRGVALGQAPITRYGHQVLIALGWLAVALLLAARLYKLTEE
jgi:hypothetical protein